MTNVLAITGMHRSGTSFVSKYLARAGLDVGEDLLPADRGNPHGYFEDAVIHDFHRELLRNAGIEDGFTVRHDDLPIPVSDAMRERAHEIVRGRDPRARWGWKEPRTALFLDLWAEVIPHAAFLFVFRDPKAVLDSLLRRATNASINERPVIGLELWRVHNEEMLRFSQTHPDRCQWWETDALTQDAEPLIETLRSRFGMALDAPPVGDVLEPGSYHREVRGRARMIALRNRAESRRCVQLYEELRALAGPRAVA